MGRITKAGNPYLRQLLVLGATAVLRFLREGKGTPNPWAIKLLERRPPAKTMRRSVLAEPFEARGRDWPLTEAGHATALNTANQTG